MEDKSNVWMEEEIGFCEGMKRNHEAEGSMDKPNHAKVNDVEAFGGRTAKVKGVVNDDNGSEGPLEELRNGHRKWRAFDERIEKWPSEVDGESFWLMLCTIIVIWTVNDRWV